MASPQPRYLPFQVEVSGRSYSGRWYVEGGVIHVESAWGSGSARLKSGGDPVALAGRVLRKAMAAGR